MVEMTNGKHLCFISPSGERIYTGTTPAVSAMRNIRAQLRRAGLKI